MWILINCGRDELSPLPIYSHTDITGPNLVTAAAASQVVILHVMYTFILNQVLCRQRGWRERGSNHKLSQWKIRGPRWTIYFCVQWPPASMALEVFQSVPAAAVIILCQVPGDRWGTNIYPQLCQLWTLELCRTALSAVLMVRGCRCQWIFAVAFKGFWESKTLSSWTGI